MKVDYVPAYLHQFAELWDMGLKYNSGVDFWRTVYDAGGRYSILDKAGLL